MPETGWPDYRHVEQYINRRILEAVGVSPLADVSNLIAGLGGNAGVANFWDCRAGVTAPSNNVSGWADCRTAGALLSTLTPGGAGTPPTISGPGSPITFAGTGTQYLANPSTAFYASMINGPVTLFYVISSTAVNATNTLGGFDSSAEEIAIETTNAPVWQAIYGTGTLVGSGVTSNATLRSIAVKLSGPNGTGSLVISGGAALTGTVTTTATTTINVSLGTVNGTGTVSQCVYAAFVVLNFVTSTAQDALMHSWAVGAHGAT